MSEWVHLIDLLRGTSVCLVHRRSDISGICFLECCVIPWTLCPHISYCCCRASGCLQLLEILNLTMDAPIIGIGWLSAVFLIIGIGRLLCRYRLIVIYYVLWWHWILKLYFFFEISTDGTNFRFIVIYANSANMLVALCSYALIYYIMQ